MPITYIKMFNLILKEESKTHSQMHIQPLKCNIIPDLECKWQEQCVYLSPDAS